MREIKFRAWNKASETMSYGLTIELIAKESEFTLYHYTDKYVWMQFTGLKDKNGMDIYDGDIIEHSDAAWRAKVEWSESGKWILNYTAMGREVLLSDRTDYIIVIDNIYQNPELL